MKWQQDVWFVCETNLTPTLNVWEISDAADFTSPLVVFWWNIKAQTSQTLSQVLKHTLIIRYACIVWMEKLADIQVSARDTLF